MSGKESPIHSTSENNENPSAAQDTGEDVQKPSGSAEDASSSKTLNELGFNSAQIEAILSSAEFMNLKGPETAVDTVPESSTTTPLSKDAEVDSSEQINISSLISTINDLVHLEVTLSDTISLALRDETLRPKLRKSYDSLGRTLDRLLAAIRNHCSKASLEDDLGLWLKEVQKQRVLANRTRRVITRWQSAAASTARETLSMSIATERRRPYARSSLKHYAIYDVEKSMRSASTGLGPPVNEWRSTMPSIAPRDDVVRPSVAKK